jgi:tetratricopeptide (TPR) repeat protein
MPVDPQKLEELFGEALAKADVQSRRAYLDQACEGDVALHQRIEALLSAHDAEGNRLDLPEALGRTTSFVPLSEQPGTRIGRFKLLEQIGDGGFGVVFMAQQDEPVRRLVALKIIKLGMDTRQVVARFEAERQALAMMDHPNVAKVLDGGATDTGRPYFVMELVKGTPITKYCDRDHLTIDERLELFLQVCHALQHAHQKGLVHRDIKPTNVLVATEDDHPVAKVIDFGVAKALQTRLTEKTLFTEFQQLVGTPAYMSPEQADGRIDVDTRSDVYSLGVLLYEIVAGTPPFDPHELSSKAFAEMQRFICDVEPPAPSTRLASLSDSLPSIAAQRKIEPARLKRLVEGELDWIVMRCLEKDRKRRYQTASAVADDLRRYLADEPIEARPVSRLYRAKKFVRRNKVGVLAVTAILAALAAGLATATVGFVHARRQTEIANREAVRSEQVAHFLKDTLEAAGPAVARGRDAALLRELLDTTAQRIERELPDQPEVRGDLYSTLGTTYDAIGDHTAGAPHLQSAVNSYESMPGDEGSKLAVALGRLGSNQSFRGEIDAGKASAQRGLDIARRGDDQAVLAECLLLMAKSCAWWGMTSEEGLPYAREALALRRRLGDDPLAEADCMRFVGGKLGNTAEGEQMLRDALSTFRQNLHADHPKIASALLGLGQSLLAQEKFEEAELVMRQVYEQYQRVQDPKNPYHDIVRRFVIEALVANGKMEEAEATLVKWSSDGHLSATTRDRIGCLYACRKMWPEAIEQFSRALELKPDADIVCYQMAIALLRAGRVDEYQDGCREYLERAAGSDNPAFVSRAWTTALLLPVEGSDFERALGVVEVKEQAANTGTRHWGYRRDALVHLRRGNQAGAIDFAQRAIDESTSSPECQAAAWFIAAAAHAQLGNRKGALASLAQGEEVVKENRTSHDTTTWRDWEIAEILRLQAAQLLETTPLNERGAGDGP